MTNVTWLTSSVTIDLNDGEDKIIRLVERSENLCLGNRHCCCARGFPFDFDEAQAIGSRVFGLNVIAGVVVQHLARLISQLVLRFHDGSDSQPVDAFTLSL